MGIPIDVLPIYLLHYFLDDFKLLVVDEFLKINGTDDDTVIYGRSNLINALQRFDDVYSFCTVPLLCSEFMRTEGYNLTFQRTAECIKDNGLTDKVLNIVPESKRHIALAREYPVHEIACVQFLTQQGFSLKIGPTKEKQYDEIMFALGFEMSFAYILDAYALGTKTSDVVVHYVPTSRGPNNGQRIFLEDDYRKVKVKLQQGCDEALRYFCKIASVSGYLLGQDYLQEFEIACLHGRKLKQEAVHLVVDNIITPFQRGV